jgi:molybdenum cofactor biosynthesis enzyme MoaA
LKAPPYHLSPTLLDGLLRQLRKDGVEEIRLVHFEGRGDPLMNPRMPELMAIVKAAYPNAFTMVTTHGSYPYKSWIVESGLDLLRVSIDGAFPENYEKYRVGGDLSTVLQFLRDVRDEKRRLGKHLEVDWKYILFEWNDSDDEMEHAARLADELDVRLRFVLTHSPGKSARFQDLSALRAQLSVVAPRALIDTTFPLKSTDAQQDDVLSVVAEEVTSLFWKSIAAIRRHDQQSALRSITKALQYDFGLHYPEDYEDCRYLIEACLPQILRRAKFPATLSGMTAVAREVGLHSAARAFFRGYLLLAAKRDLAKGDWGAVAKRLALWMRASVALRSRLRGRFSEPRHLGSRARQPE